MNKKHQIIVLHGDGIGLELVREGVKVLSVVAGKFGFVYDLQEGIVCGAERRSFDRH